MINFCIIVVICFQISIFDTIGNNASPRHTSTSTVVICFQISIFDTIGNNIEYEKKADYVL